MIQHLEGISAVILCGGFGRRLRPVVGDEPKVMSEINGKAFLEILIDNLLRFGFKHIILCVGYQKEKIINHFAVQQRKTDYSLIFSKEEAPLDTGGALKNAESLIKSDTFLAMNGDSFCDVDFNKFFNFHFKKRAVLTIALSRSKKTQDFGYIELDDLFRIKDFKEKIASAKNAFVNAGVYIMQKDVFRKMPNKDVFSLEYDFFPIIKEFGCYGYITKSELFDIGTPERYEDAKQAFKIDRFRNR